MPKVYFPNCYKHAVNVNIFCSPMRILCVSVTCFDIGKTRSHWLSNVWVWVWVYDHRSVAVPVMSRDSVCGEYIITLLFHWISIHSILCHSVNQVANPQCPYFCIWEYFFTMNPFNHRHISVLPRLSNISPFINVSWRIQCDISKLFSKPRGSFYTKPLTLCY